MLIIKGLCTFFLLCFFIAGIKRADRNSHLDKEYPMAEYITGFLFTFFPALAFYHLWW
jgi:hypothetical protein